MSLPPASGLTRSILIGNLPFTFTFPSPSRLSLFLRQYRAFISSGGQKKPHIAVRGKRSSMTMPDGQLSVALKGNRWALDRYDFASLSDTAFSRTDLSVERNRYAFDSWLRVFCTLYGLSRNALLVHAAGCCLNGKTFLFPGRSGQGKSTLIRILGKKCALSDELTLVYERKKRFRAASTPFWGELKKGDGTLHDGPLQAVCLLEKGNRTTITRIAPKAALPRLLETVLFFSNEPSMMAQLLALTAALLENVPVYLLTFAKTASRSEVINLLAAL